VVREAGDRRGEIQNITKMFPLIINNQSKVVVDHTLAPSSIVFASAGNISASMIKVIIASALVVNTGLWISIPRT